jgi:hypothetical protein
MAAGVLLAALPMRDDDRVDAPFLADHREVRVLGQHRLRPIAQELRVRVAEGVLADAGQPGVLDPPQGVLDEIARQVRVALVEVGHGVDEPAVGEGLAVRGRRMRILDRGAAVVGGGERAAVVDPVLRRQVGHPPVLRTDVVEHDVHDQADALRPRLARQRTHVLVATHARIRLVEIGDRVAVVAVLRLVVFQEGRRPQLGEAHPGDVVDVLAHAGDVAAVAAVGIRAVGRFKHAGDAVVRWIAIGEPVRRHQVDRIARIEAAASRGTRFARVEPPGMRRHDLAGVDEFDVDAARYRIAGDLDGDEQVVRVVGLLHVDDGHARTRQSRRRCRDTRAMHQQLDPVVAHAHPPVGRFDAFDVDGTRRRRHAEQQRKRAEDRAHQAPPKAAMCQGGYKRDPAWTTHAAGNT